MGEWQLWHPTFGQSGRLGNQLWQLAGLAALADRLGLVIALQPEWVYRFWFDVPADMYAIPGIGAHDVTAHVDYLPAGARPYLQDLSLWSPRTADQMRSWIRPSATAADDGAWCAMAAEFDELPGPVLGIHVRRGDNASNPNENHPLRPTSYYRAALDLLAGDYPTVAVFTDDPAWCIAAFAAGGELHVPGKRTPVFYSGARPKEHTPEYLDPGRATDWIDLLLLARCDAHIIANSSFGWWGAFLADSDAVIYPWPWYGPGLADTMNAELMLPGDWTRLAHE